MAAAEVGDDVLGRDPTMRELETRVAGLLGTDDALWTPSGSMGNLIALMHHLDRGDAFLAPAGAHVLDSELGTAAWLAGGMPRPLEHDAGPGKVSPAAVRRARARRALLHAAHHAAVPGEHPQRRRRHGDRPRGARRLAAAARAAKLRVHLDGARLWHAAVALGVPPAALTVGADTVQVCLSKGLGAPVGSAVAGSAEFVEQARRLRKMLGGGVRQGGMIAAAGLRRASTGSSVSPRTTSGPGRWPPGCASAAGRSAIPETNIVLVAVADLAGRCAGSRRPGCGRRHGRAGAPGHPRRPHRRRHPRRAGPDRAGRRQRPATGGAAAVRAAGAGAGRCSSASNRALIARSSASTSASCASARPTSADTSSSSRSTAAPPAQVLHEPGGHRCGHHAEQRDAGHHQRRRHEPSLGGHRVAVAVADGGDRRDRPPHRLAERGHRRVRRVPLGVEHRERATNPIAPRCRDVEHDPAADVVVQLPVQHAHHGDQRRARSWRSIGSTSTSEVEQVRTT